MPRSARRLFHFSSTACHSSAWPIFKIGAEQRRRLVVRKAAARSHNLTPKRGLFRSGNLPVLTAMTPVPPVGHPLIDGLEPRWQTADCARGPFLLPPQLTRPCSAGHPGTHPGPGSLPTRRPSSPSSRGVQNKRRWTKIRGQSSTTSGRPHFCAHRTPRRNRLHSPALDQRCPANLVPIRGVMLTPWPVVDNIRRAFLYAARVGPIAWVMALMPV
jgi:hypothetical protein